MHNKEWDFRPDLAHTYANALKNAVELHIPNDIKKKQGFFLSKKDGFSRKLFYKDIRVGFDDKLYVGDINRIERHLYWNDEELQEDDEIINVVVVDGPVTRDGDGCSYGTKDFRDQVMYANTIPQVIGHLFIINTPGGQASCRNDYEMMINDCREKGKPTVAFVDGMCCSSGVNLACRLDRVVVMNPKDEFGCIGTMAAFWAVAHDTVDQDGFRYVELVGKDCPEKNDWYREAAKGEYEKLQAELDKDTDDFHNEVRQNRPLVTDDMLTGKVFEAQEVIPALVDEIGDMNRAIECVFELANETLTAARLVTAEPKEDDDHHEDHDEPEELAKLNEQQKAAINKEKGNMTVIDDGHVSAERQGFFGPTMEEIATPKNDNDMTDEEKKAQEAQGAQAAQEATEQAAAQEETPASEQQDAQEQPSEEAVQEAQEEIDKIKETLHNAEQMIADKDKKIADMQSIIDTKTEAFDTMLKSFDEQSKILAESQNLVAEKDKEIAELKFSIAEEQANVDNLKADISDKDDMIAGRDKSIEQLNATIETLKKQVADLKAEVKEMAGKPAPMTNADAGIPQDNGTGEGPKNTGSGITSDMDYSEIRAAVKKAAAGKAKKKEVK